VLLFLITLELFSLSVAAVAGFLAALSPQFAYFSVLLLPDSLIVFPILLAIYLVVKSRERFSWSRLFIAGLLIGVSCWLRANALFLPIFIAIAAALTTTKNKRVTAAVAVIAGAVVAIAPITIKNAIAFHRFIPISLGSGQTLLEGLADYDPYGTLNIPHTDLGITRQEAEWSGRPDYAVGLFAVDGIERDRLRVKRGLKTIAEHPVWFAGVMGKRALASTRLDPVPVLQPESPLSHRTDVQGLQPSWTKSSAEWLDTHDRSPNSTLNVVDNEWLKIVGDKETYGNQLSSEVINVQTHHDYVLRVPLKLERGRIKLKVMSSSKDLAWVNVETLEVFAATEQPVTQVELPFVSANNSQVRIVIANSASSVAPTLLLGKAQLFDLGTSSLTWLRYLRMPLRLPQKLFTTAWAIPFVVIGLVLLLLCRRFQELALLLAVPAYYLIVQSALHTERRYVYVIHYCFIVITSFAVCRLVQLAKVKVWQRPSPQPTHQPIKR